MSIRPIPAYTFGIAQTFDNLDTGWRSFPGHYLLYAAQGVFHLEAANARWFLPPQRVAWVRADESIRLRTQGPVSCNSVLFGRSTISALPFPCRVFDVTPLVREMICYTLRWGVGRDPDDAVAERFFRVLADLCIDLAEQPDVLWLPRPTSPELARAMEYTLADLSSSLQFGDVAQVVGVSERTLARRFSEETHMTWRQFVGRARMIRAMELLSDQDVPVIEVAYTVGFESVSAFSTAFRRFVGETPSRYRSG
jgi:AraC-like DNA-binding protein